MIWAVAIIIIGGIMAVWAYVIWDMRHGLATWPGVPLYGPDSRRALKQDTSDNSLGNSGEGLRGESFIHGEDQ